MSTLRSFGAMLNQVGTANKPFDANPPKIQRPMKPISKTPGAALWSKMLQMTKGK